MDDNDNLAAELAFEVELEELDHADDAGDIEQLVAGVRGARLSGA
jgi:hypothetical protein